jgi:hypothetical protein
VTLLRFFVGQKYRNRSGDYVVVETKNHGNKGGLLKEVDGGEALVWFEADRIMEAGQWEFISSSRFKIGDSFVSVANPACRAVVTDVRKDGKEWRVQFLNEAGERIGDEKWHSVQTFLTDDQWRLPPAI